MDNVLNSCMHLCQSLVLQYCLFVGQPEEEHPSCVLYQKFTIATAVGVLHLAALEDLKLHHKCLLLVRSLPSNYRVFF